MEPVDLIWCGSLFTHIDENSASQLLRFFYQNLAPGGICAFTTHGKRPLELLQGSKGSYLLDSRARLDLVAQYREPGYGFRSYRWKQGYGISLVTREKLNAMASEAGDWAELLFVDRGWDDHQDAFVFQRV